MADTRSLNDIDTTVADQAAQLQDLKTTVMARLGTCPTGDIEPTLRTTPKNGTLILNGQTVNRVDYPALWQWAQDQSLVRANLFGAGNGSTTFVLPDMRGRVIRGVATAETTGTLTGTDSHVITSGELPTHSHSGSTGSGGVHSGHFPQGIPIPAGSDGATAVGQGGPQDSASHTHTLTINNAGSSSAMDMRQAGIAINWLIWV